MIFNRLPHPAVCGTSRWAAPDCTQKHWGKVLRLHAICAACELCTAQNRKEQLCMKDISKALSWHHASPSGRSPINVNKMVETCVHRWKMCSPTNTSAAKPRHHEHQSSRTSSRSTAEGSACTVPNGITHVPRLKVRCQWQVLSGPLSSTEESCPAATPPIPLSHHDSSPPWPNRRHV